MREKIELSKHIVEWIAKKLGDMVRQNLKITNAVLNQMLRKVYGVEATNHTLWRAKRIALYGLDAEHKLEFSRSRWYIYEVMAKNPWSLSVIKENK